MGKKKISELQLASSAEVSAFSPTDLFTSIIDGQNRNLTKSQLAEILSLPGGSADNIQDSIITIITSEPSVVLFPQGSPVYSACAGAFKNVGILDIDAVAQSSLDANVTDCFILRRNIVSKPTDMPGPVGPPGSPPDDGHTTTDTISFKTGVFANVRIDFTNAFAATIVSLHNPDETPMKLQIRFRFVQLDICKPFILGGGF